MSKICTSLEQSKKLIELGVDINTADMAYWKRSYQPNDYAIMVHHTKELQEGFEAKCIEYIPAWSLSALLEIIRNNGRYELQMYEGGYYFEANGFMTESYFNPVYACVEMIMKLHELKLL